MGCGQSASKPVEQSEQQQRQQESRTTKPVVSSGDVKLDSTSPKLSNLTIENSSKNGSGDNQTSDKPGNSIGPANNSGKSDTANHTDTNRNETLTEKKRVRPPPPDLKIKGDWRNVHMDAVLAKMDNHVWRDVIRQFQAKKPPVIKVDKQVSNQSFQINSVISGSFISATQKSTVTWSGI